jgi:iron complex outermembrane recepter protein
MRSIFAILVFTIASFNSLFAGTVSASITGKVVNNEQKVLPKIVMTLWKENDSSSFKIAVTESNGQFELINIPSGNYWIESSGIGYKSDTTKVFEVAEKEVNLPTITLKPQVKSLDGVTTVAKIKKPFIEVKADKTIINVESSINATGSNALDILRKSPGVSIDKDDNISLKGKAGVIVYIDGKQTYLDNATIASILRGTQSTNIESIEIISNPSAKYDAAGNAGIINIKMKKSKKLGTNGSVAAGFNYGYTPKTNATITLNNNNKKTNYFLLYGFENGNNQNFQNFFRQQGTGEYNQSAVNNSNGIAHNYKLGVDYKLNDKHTFGAMVNGNYNDGYWTNISRAEIGKIGLPYNQLLLASNKIDAVKNSRNANINYKFADTNGTSFNIDIDGGMFNSTSRSYQPNRYQNLDGSLINELIFKNSTPTDINIFTIKADYERNFYRGKLGFGAKSSFVNTDNDFKFYNVINSVDELSKDNSNHFIYKENVNAAYANYNRKLSKKIDGQFGLRLEQTNSVGELTSLKANSDTTVKRTYTNLFPSASFSYTRNAKHSFALSLSRRITRPSYQDLNPFENKLDELTYEKGNAFLRPQYAYSSELTHTFMGFLNSTFSFSRITDLYTQITDTASGSRAFITQKNIANSNVWGLNIGAPLPIKKWWFGYVSLGANYTATNANFDGNIIAIKYPSANLYSEHNFTLPKNYSASVSGWYAIPGYWGGTFKTKSLGAMDLGVQKNFMSGKLVTKVSMTDVFWSSRWRGISDFAGLYFDANGGNESRQLRLNATYKFGSNQVAKARDRKTGLSDEADRIKGGK